jgi:hypothetical protein
VIIMAEQLEFYFPKSKAKHMSTPKQGKVYPSKGGSIRFGVQAIRDGGKSLPKFVTKEKYETYGFSVKNSETVGHPTPANPLEEVPAILPSPAEPTNENFSAHIRGGVSVGQKKIQSRKDYDIENEYDTDLEVGEIDLDDYTDELENQFNDELVDAIRESVDDSMPISDGDTGSGSVNVDTEIDITVPVSGDVNFDWTSNEENEEEHEDDEWDADFSWNAESFSAEREECPMGTSCPTCYGQGSPYGCGGDYCGWCGTDWKQPCDAECPAYEIEFGNWANYDEESFNAEDSCLWCEEGTKGNYRHEGRPTDYCSPFCYNKGELGMDAESFDQYGRKIRKLVGNCPVCHGFFDVKPPNPEACNCDEDYDAESLDKDLWMDEHISMDMPEEMFPRLHDRYKGERGNVHFDSGKIVRVDDEYYIVIKANQQMGIKNVYYRNWDFTLGPYPYTAKGWFNGYMQWKNVPMRGRDWAPEVQEALGDYTDGYRPTAWNKGKGAESYGADGATQYRESLRNRDGINRVYCLVCNKLYKSKDGSPIGFTMRNCCGQETETDPNKIDFLVNYKNKDKKNAESEKLSECCGESMSQRTAPICSACGKVDYYIGLDGGGYGKFTTSECCGKPHERKAVLTCDKCNKIDYYYGQAESFNASPRHTCNVCGDVIDHPLDIKKGLCYWHQPENKEEILNYDKEYIKEHEDDEWDAESFNADGTNTKVIIGAAGLAVVLGLWKGKEIIGFIDNIKNAFK